MVNESRLARIIFSDIATDICEELDRRGFATEIPVKEREMEKWIFNLLCERLQGNVNVNEVQPDGWDNDLTNQ